MGLAPESSARPLLAPGEAPGDGKISINSFEKKEDNNTDGERRRLLPGTNSDKGLDDEGAQSHYQPFASSGDVTNFQPVKQN